MALQHNSSMKEAETTGLFLAKLFGELKYLEGGFFSKAQETPQGWMKIKVNTKEHGTVDLIANSKALSKTNYKVDAIQQTTGFAAFLDKRLSNRKILGLNYSKTERKLEMEFQDSILAFEFFAKGNVLLLDKERRIISSKIRKPAKKSAGKMEFYEKM